MNNNALQNIGTNESDLIDRYVYAAVKRLPYSTRNDVDRELHSIISDMLEARCGENAPTEQDVKAVLTELGTPSELSAKYDPNSERSLISPKYFPTYYTVLKIVMICTFAGLAISGIINLIVDPSEFFSLDGTVQQNAAGIGMLIAKALGTLTTVAISVFGGVTALFAFFEYKNVELDSSEDDLSRLPAVPSEEYRIKRSECIVGIVFSVLFLLLMCFAPQVMSIYVLSDTSGYQTAIPVFDTAVVKSMWPIWAAFFALGAGRELCKLFIGVYNRLLLFIIIIADTFSALLAGIAFLPRNILNPEIADKLKQAVTANGDTLDVSAQTVLDILGKGFNRIFFAVLVFALTLDMITAIVKTVKYIRSTQDK